MTDPTELLALAADVARRAGRHIVDARPRQLGAEAKSSPTDMVTEMDTASERLLVDALLSARPDDGLLGEEGSDRSGTSGVRWVIDPIDGTTNYLYDLPQYAVSVAAQVDGESVAGVVYNPVTDELFSAVRGGGATCNGTPLHCTAASDLAQALVATGFGYAADRRAKQAQVLTAVLPRVRDIRRLGSAALDLCAVAAGRVDGYYERGTAPWDTAAGGLIATEAGARFLDLEGRLVVAAAPGVFEALHELVLGAGAAED